MRTSPNSPATVKLNDKQAFAAVLKRDAEKLMAHLDMGVSVDTCGELPPYYSQVPLLVAAAMEGSPECVQLLLSRGADPNLRGISNQRPDLPGISALVGVLRESFDPDSTEQSKRREIVKLLLEAGADPDGVHQEVELPMKWAIKRGYKDVPEDLISAGAKSHTDPYFGVLHEAARTGAKQFVQRLLRDGMPVNAIEKHGTTPLHAATFAAQAGVAEYLLSAGGDPNCIRPGGWTPLHNICDHASRLGLEDQFQADLAIIKLLLKHGAEINRRTPDGETPLALASVGGSANPVMELLKSHGATL